MNPYFPQLSVCLPIDAQKRAPVLLWKKKMIQSSYEGAGNKITEKN